MGGKCQPECVLAPYFPPDQPHKLANVHKVFGAINVTKLLNELHPHQRKDAVNSLAYEADMRLRDPIYGCVGMISLLQHQLRQFQVDLTCAKLEVSKYQSLGLITAAHHHHHHHHHQNVGITHQQRRRRRRSCGPQGPPPRRGPLPVLPKGSGGGSSSGSCSTKCSGVLLTSFQVKHLKPREVV